MTPYLSRAREPISSFTHLFGAVVFGIGTVLLLWKGLAGRAGWLAILSAGVFGLSLIALYSASAIYHYVNASEKVTFILRKLDHSMIYVLIAGSYTPILLYYLPTPKNYLFTAAIWATAAVGIAVKLLWFSAPRWLYTGFYIFMGWFIAFDFAALSALEPGALALLAAGGISYTVGGVIYAIKKPNISEKFGHHEIFHLFVLLGSLLHYLIVFMFVV